MATPRLWFLHDFDAQTLALIARLQSEDVELLEDDNGKGREGDVTDIQRLGRETAAAAAQVAADRRLAQSMDEVFGLFARLNTQHGQEVTELADPAPEQHPAAEVNQNMPAVPATLPRASPPSSASSPQAVNVLPDSTESSDGSEPADASSWTSSRKTDLTEPDRSCTVCLDHYSPNDLCSQSCKHDYCKTCLQSLLETCIKDESLFPPRCCQQEIDTSPYLSWLPEDLVLQFEAKREEYNTTDKTYCHQPTCSTFITLANVADGVAKCPTCQFETCHTCKAAVHTGDCASDPATKMTLDLARVQGWQRCPRCSAVVELTVGCYHMTCRCGAGFCYLCAATWKTCLCPQWDEDRLVARAEQLVGRGRGGNGARPYAGEVREAAEYLRDNHACNHHGRWNRVDGAHVCEECGEWLRDFIFQCPHCRLQACANCRRNRL